MKISVFIVTLIIIQTSNSLPFSTDVEILPKPNRIDVQLFSPDDYNSAEETSFEDYESGPSASGEVMKTSANLVFRPLFSYRKIQEKRRRVPGRKPTSLTNPNTVRRSEVVYYSQPSRYGYPYPVYYYGNK